MFSDLHFWRSHALTLTFKNEIIIKETNKHFQPSNKSFDISLLKVQRINETKEMSNSFSTNKINDKICVSFNSKIYTYTLLFTIIILIVCVRCFKVLFYILLHFRQLRKYPWCLNKILLFIFFLFLLFM